MPIEKQVLRERIENRGAAEISDVWISRGKPSETAVAKEMDNLVWIAGKEGEFCRAVVHSIESACDFICFSTFLFGDESIERALLDASLRGVRVYMLCPSERTSKQLEDEEEIDQRIEEHKQFLDRVGGRVLIRSAEHLHSKFILIDPVNPTTRAGFLSTANFNKALYDNPEIMVRLSDDEVESVFAQFVNAFWEQAETEHRKTGEGKGRFTPVSQPPSDLDTRLELCHLPITVKSHNSKAEKLSLRREVLDLISSSEGPLTISTYGIDNSHEVAEAIIHQAKSREITMLVPLRSANSEAYAQLKRAGIKIVGMNRLHAKTIVGQKEGKDTALLMTANLQPKGLDEGYETGLLLHDERMLKVKEIIECWRQSAPWMYADTIKIGNATREILVSREESTHRGTSQRYVTEEVHEMLEVDLADVHQLTLEIEPEPRMVVPSTLAKKVKYLWRVLKPTLPSDTEKMEESEQEGIPLFKKGNQVFIAVTEEDEIPKAVELKQSKYRGAQIVIAT